MDGRKAWYKESCANGDPKGLDPFKWSILDVNDDLAELKQDASGGCTREVVLEI